MSDIPDLFARAKRPLFSFEFFLPKSPEGVTAFMEAARDISSLRPDFISLTYGAGGSARGLTVETAGRLQAETGVTTACHLTCIAHTRGEIAAILARLSALNIRHIVALRGDRPKEAPAAGAATSDFAHAEDLVRTIRAREEDFRVAVAAYPEKHPEAPTAETDLAHFGRKVSAGADWAITQLFFDPRHYFSFVRRARAAGISAPILPGIMPVTNYAQVARFSEMCGVEIPPDLNERLLPVKDDLAATAKVGVDWASAQARALLDGGAPGIHFYTLNKSSATAEILSRLRRA